MNQNHLEQGFAAMNDLKSGISPPAPRLDLFRDSCGLLGILDPLCIDRRGLGCLPCSVQGFGKMYVCQ